MSELIIFPDVEQLCIDALDAGFEALGDPARWSTSVPDPRPAEFGRILRTGGPQETLISENATIVVEGWAATESRALAIANFGRAVLLAQDGTLFGATVPGGLGNLPDPTTSQIRYTLTMGVRVRGSVHA